MAAMAQVVHRCPESRFPAVRNRHPPALAARRASTFSRKVSCSLASNPVPVGAERAPKLASRRVLWVSVGALLGLQLQRHAGAKGIPKDIPLFGIKKRPQGQTESKPKEPVVEKAAAKVEEIVSETKNQVASFSSKISSPVAPSSPPSSSSSDSFGPTLQAGAVVAAELLGVVIATSIVSGLVTSKSK